jgi:catechol 2,3-dioxygenase-like lactoylglutathione lyase family enzyme
MPVHRIDHVTINASDLERTCAFYRDVLGFEPKRMEGYGHVGAWLFLDGHPFIHVMARPAEQSGELRPLVDHFALSATGLAETRAKLKSMGIPTRETPLPQFDLHQIVIHDPDGMKVELNFQGCAAQGAEAA